MTGAGSKDDSGVLLEEDKGGRRTGGLSDFLWTGSAKRAGQSPSAKWWRKQRSSGNGCMTRRRHAVRGERDTGMDKPPTKNEILLARVAIVLIVGLAAAGVIWYGVSTETIGRMWGNIAARPGGPMTFRFVLQPAMAALAALRDGVEDARLGRTPYLAAIMRGVEEGRRARLWEGIISTSRILILGVIMDVVYQLAFLETFYPAESALIAILLAFVPYALLRGPFERLARHWVARKATG